MSDRIECPNCGSLNDKSYEACWSCKASLVSIHSSVSLKKANSESEVVMTTSQVLGQGQPFQEIRVLSSEVVFGMNAFKELFKGIRDIVGGRSDTLEKLMKESRETALAELQREAFALGADAVVAIDLDYVDVGSSGGGMTLLVATGTAVKRV